MSRKAARKLDMAGFYSNKGRRPKTPRNQTVHLTLTKSRKSLRKTVPTSRPRPKAHIEDESDSLLKVEGIITSMVRILEHFTVRDQQNNRFVRLTWTPKTRFVRSGKSAGSTALRIGQPVKVSCDLADKALLAEVVTIHSAHAR